MGAPIDLTGKRFSRLAVVGRDKTGPRRRLKCLCDCGKTCVIMQYNLRNGHTKSCGCILREIMKKRLEQRVTHLPEYRTWKSIKARTTNKNTVQYKDYGGRGIKMCDQWMRSFKRFLSDVGSKPSPLHSLDRIDNDRGYSPRNVRWVTNDVQCMNTRRSKRITFNGETRPLLEWAKIYGIKYPTLRARIYKLGWNAKRAMTTPVFLGRNQFGV